MRSFFMPLALLLCAAGMVVAEERIYVAESGESRVTAIEGAGNRVVGQITVSGAPQAIAVSVDGRRLFVSGETKNAVDVVDRLTGKLIRSVATGRRPGDLVLAPEGRKLFVAARGAGAVEVIDTATLEKVKTIFTGKEPAGMALTPDNTRIVAASAGERKLSVINIRTEAVEFEIPVAGVPQAVAFEADKSLTIHRVFVLLAGDGGVEVMDWATRKAVSRLAGAARGVAASPDGKMLWVAMNDAVTVYALPELKKAATVQVGKGASAIVFTPDGKRGLVAGSAEGTVSVVDAAAWKELARVAAGAGPRGIAVAE